MCMISILSHVKYSVDKFTRITGGKQQTPRHYFGAKWVRSEIQYADYSLRITGSMIEIRADSIQKQLLKHCLYYC